MVNRKRKPSQFLPVAYLPILHIIRQRGLLRTLTVFPINLLREPYDYYIFIPSEDIIATLDTFVHYLLLCYMDIGGTEYGLE